MFNSKYKKGMADAAKAYEAFGQKQEAVLDKILEEVRRGNRSMEDALNEIGGNVDNLYDHLQSKEKAELYTVYTPFNIKDLGSQEKLFLVGALLRLTTDKEPNENQQNYLRAIQRYLDIKEPPFGTDPLMIENIEDIPAQKAILQAVMEFLRLQDGDSYDETELQQEFLDAFSVNSKGRKTIMEQVEMLYNATGAVGLAEKYGYVVEESVLLSAIEESVTDSSKQVLSREAARKAYDFTQEHGHNLAESDNYYLTENDDYRGNQKVILYEKATGEEKDITSVGKGLLEDFWDECKYYQDDIFILTRSGTLFHVEPLTTKCNIVFSSQDNIDSFTVTENMIHIKANSRSTLIDWNGEILHSYDDSSANSEWQYGHIFFYNDCMWSLYSSGWNETTWKLYKSTQDKADMKIVLEASKGFEPEEVLVANSKLYILAENRNNRSYEYSKRSIFSIDLEVPTDFQEIISNITIYNQTILGPIKRSLPSGWVFIGEDDSSPLREYKLMYFSCENEKISILAKDCGKCEVRTHVFKKDDVFHYIGQVNVIGEYIFFNIGMPISAHPTRAMVSIHEPQNVQILQ